MANLSIIGSHSVNGVAALHTDILKDTVFHDFYKLFPDKFNNKTNGVSHRRFLVQSNPALARLITEAIGDGWIEDMTELERLLDFRTDAAFLERLRGVKLQNKVRLADYIYKTSGVMVDPQSVFDIQVKRIHAYKRQLLNAFKVLDLYNRLRENPDLAINPYTFLFSGKAAQGYAFAKEVIKFITSVADVVNADPVVSQKIRVVFLENFCVSNAQLIYPAADISEQISTAGKEASGTGNMKLMMNGAVTIGTLDGANVEIRNLVGDGNITIFRPDRRRGRWRITWAAATAPRRSAGRTRVLKRSRTSSSTASSKRAAATSGAFTTRFCSITTVFRPARFRCLQEGLAQP